MEGIDDLIFAANTLATIFRFSEAIEQLEMFVAAKPVLDSTECRLFERVFKQAIDPTRATLRSLVSCHKAELEDKRVDRAEGIQHQKDMAHAELNSRCEKAISLIKSMLLPNACDSRARVFFHKSVGDYCRYVAEFESGDAYKHAIEEAETNYKTAIEIGDLDLMKSDPLRLGAVLNYAVLQFEHLKCVTEACNLLQRARTDAELDLPKLEESEQNDALGVLRAMQTNLVIWSDDDSSLQ